MSKLKKANNKGFTLLEVLVAVAILGLGIVFVFRSFFTVLEAEKISQSVLQNCFLAEDYLWQIEMDLKNNFKNTSLADSYKITDLIPSGLKELDLSVDKSRGSLNLKSYLYKRI